MGNAQERPSETIDRERKRLVETLQADSGLLLDALLARGVLTGPEYEALDALPDAERRVRRLLLVVQSKGEAACQELLRCAQRTVRAPDPTWDWQHVGPGYRDRYYDPPCPGHRTPACPGLPQASDSDGTRDLRAPRQGKREPSGSPSRKLRPLTRLSRSRNLKRIRIWSRNPKSQSRHKSQKPSQSRNLKSRSPNPSPSPSRSPSRSPSPNPSLNPSQTTPSQTTPSQTTGLGMSQKIPECLGAAWPGLH